MAQTDRRAQDTNAVDEPYVPAARRLPEITLKALLLAVVLAVVLAGANAYLGLKVGLTVSASIPAAVISMAILRFFRESNILENNIVQTAASSGEALAAGVIFTLPALVILRYWQGFEWLPVMAVAITGGILGVMFTIPLRRALILQTRLKFPEGVATGEVLKVGAEGGRGAKTLALAAGAAAVFKLCQTGFGVAASAVSGAVAAGGAIFAVGSGLAVALLGVGYIVGLNIAVLVFMGGAISWFIGIPLYMVLAGPDQVQTITQGAAGYEAALAVWSERIRYLGVGAMAVGGCGRSSLWPDPCATASAPPLMPCAGRAAAKRAGWRAPSRTRRSTSCSTVRWLWWCRSSLSSCSSSTRTPSASRAGCTSAR